MGSDNYADSSLQNPSCWPPPPHFGHFLVFVHNPLIYYHVSLPLSLSLSLSLSLPLSLSLSLSLTPSALSPCALGFRLIYREAELLSTHLASTLQSTDFLIQPREPEEQPEQPEPIPEPNSQVDAPAAESRWCSTFFLLARSESRCLLPRDSCTCGWSI